MRHEPPCAAPTGLLRRGRPRKAWRYVGVYSAELMLCAGRVSVGGLPQSFWAVWEPGGAGLVERTRTGGRRVDLGAPDAPAVRVADGSVEIALRLEPAGAPIAVRNPHGRGEAWTRKSPVRAVGTVRIGGRARRVDAHGLVDDSAGHHARETDWRWSAGTGALTDGRAVTWNLVDGLHDGPVGRSERFVWVDGTPHEVGPVAFAQDLGSVAFAEGGALVFTAGATRERSDRVLGGLLASDYLQPFGVFGGALPGSGVLASGHGVMESHRARW